MADLNRPAVEDSFRFFKKFSFLLLKPKTSLLNQLVKRNSYGFKLNRKSYRSEAKIKIDQLLNEEKKKIRNFVSLITKKPLDRSISKI